jgi:hypothetical protein
MRRFLLAATLVLAGATGTPARAEGDGSNWGTITEFYVDAKMTVMRLTFSREVINPSNCEAGDFYMLELDDSPASERFVRVVLAAHLANRKVKFWVDGCTRQQWWGKTRPLIYDVYIGD